MKGRAHTAFQRYEAENIGPSKCRYLGRDPLAIVNQTTNLKPYANPPVLGCAPMNYTRAPFPIRELRRMVGMFQNTVDSASHKGAHKLSA
jgi:hypothetical protein